MPRGKDTKVWNEELVEALDARAELCRQQGKSTFIGWAQGAEKVRNIRQDIYTFANFGTTGRIVNFPSGLGKTVDTVCRGIIAGSMPKFPPGYIPTQPHHQQQQQHYSLTSSITEMGGTPISAAGGASMLNPYYNDPYLNKIKQRGGAYAILLAFHVSGSSVMTKAQICAAAQPFCDEEMTENYFAGRTRGAWAGHATLSKHNLLLVQHHRAFSERAHGIRSLGASTYALTSNGERFIEALLKKFPQAQHDVQRVTDRGQVSSSIHRSPATLDSAILALTNTNTSDNTSDKGYRLGSGNSARKNVSTVVFDLVGNMTPEHSLAPTTPPRSTLSLPSISSSTGSDTKKRSGKASQDEIELQIWLQNAQDGGSKEKLFRVSKARRTLLHELCTRANETILGGTSKFLTHESYGTGRSRTLVVTLHQRKLFSPVNALASMPTACQSHSSPSLTGSVALTGPSSSPLSGRHPRNSGGLEIQDHSTPSKRVKRVPAGIAAANAAIQRQEMHQQQQQAATKDTVYLTGHQSISNTVTPIDRNVEVLELDVKDSKPSARLRPSSVRSRDCQETAAGHCVIMDLFNGESSDSSIDDDIFRPRFAQHITATSRSSHTSDNAIDLTVDESQDSCVVVVGVKAASEAGAALTIDANAERNSSNNTTRENGLLETRQLLVMIDNRERNRNTSPRMLRMELTRLLQKGPVSVVWPRAWPTAYVEESKLSSGDFSFFVEGITPQWPSHQLPIWVERKRVADLVQRSFHKDHWYQLHRMLYQAKSYAQGRTVFLLEGDLRSAAQYTAFGAQDDENYDNPLRHCIDNEESLLRFMFRAVLLSRNVRFAQAKDEQASLRLVGSIGLIAAIRDHKTSAPRESNFLSADGKESASAVRSLLKDRLIKAGIPGQLAARVSDEIGSEKQLDSLYCEIGNEDCRDRLLSYLISDLCNDQGTTNPRRGSSLAWSSAIHRAYYSSLADPTMARFILSEVEHLVQDHASLLSKLHSGLDTEAAVAAVLDAEPSQSQTKGSERVVSITLPAKYLYLFPIASNGACFYRLVVSDQMPGSSIPNMVMQTCEEGFLSDRVVVFLVEGVDIVRRLAAAPTVKKESVDVTRDVARKLREDCVASCQDYRPDKDTAILLVRALSNALDQQAKRSDYRGELRVMVDLLVADCLLDNLVVVHAVRLDHDRELILQQMALACFRYQYMTHPAISK